MMKWMLHCHWHTTLMLSTSVLLSVCRKGGPAAAGSQRGSSEFEYAHSSPAEGTSYFMAVVLQQQDVANILMAARGVHAAVVCRVPQS
jgi:hypothetical protein